jgi:hypothetical protein
MIKYLLSILFFAILFLGCAKQYQESSIDDNLSLLNEKEELLAERFLEYWHYYNTRDFNTSYTYELPSYRFHTSLKEYKRHIGTSSSFLHVSLKKIAYQYDDNNIAITSQYLKIKKRPLNKEKWIYVNGTWYHRYFKPDFPTPDDI